MRFSALDAAHVMGFLPHGWVGTWSAGSWLDRLAGGPAGLVVRGDAGIGKTSVWSTAIGMASGSMIQQRLMALKELVAQL